MSFTVGEIVLLKSGGPEMTLDSIDGEYGWCSWFTAATRHKDKFRLTSLKRYTAPVPQTGGNDYNPYGGDAGGMSR